MHNQRRILGRWTLPSFVLTLGIVFAMVLMFVPSAKADNVQNDVVAGGNDTFTAGGSTTINYRITANNGDGQTGCNAADLTPATVAPNVPGQVSVSPSSLNFTSCGTFQSVVFSSNTPGDYTITASVSDGGTGTYNTNPATFTLHVLAAPPPTNTAPTLFVPADITAEATSGSGAAVSYSATASDTEDGALTPTCNPASGATFPLGITTTVSCSVTDSGGLSANGSFTVTVVDSTAPVIAAHGDETAEATGPSGAAVTYTSPAATDAVDGTQPASCSPASGSTFALGATTVTCNAVDAAGNHATAITFTVTVVDTTDPVFGALSDQSFEGNATGGANVTYTLPTASDIVDSSVSVVCLPASPSFFALGTTAVNCTATDDSGNDATGSFNVIVQDTTDPVFGALSDQTFEGDATGGANVTYTLPTATDIVDNNVSVVCVPAPGAFFALGGPTSVNCTATDDSGNDATGSFGVTVVDTTKPSITCPANVTAHVGDPVSLGSPTVSDIVDANPTVDNNAPGSFGPGTTSVTWTATDHSNNAQSCVQMVTLTYYFTGFFQPIDNGVLNSVKAGSAIPVKFSLGGNMGLNIFAAGYPASAVVPCNTSVEDAIEETLNAGSSTLTYDATANQYVYVWKTDKAWANSCRTLVVKLADGTMHTANFNFKR